jgi:hypothetical protein
MKSRDLLLKTTWAGLLTALWSGVVALFVVDTRPHLAIACLYATAVTAMVLCRAATIAVPERGQKLKRKKSCLSG